MILKKIPLAFKELRRKTTDSPWLSEMTASGVATIIGISLTFGIDSYVETKRMKGEFRESLLQAVDNIAERFTDAQEWVKIVENQNRIYNIADSIYVSGNVLPDSICNEFRYTMPYIKISAFDHEFEKIFRSSYQLWQLHNHEEKLTYYIGGCYDALNIVEQTCEALTTGLVEQISIINAKKHFYRLDNRKWTMALITDSEFQCYMSVRKVKSRIVAGMLEQAFNDYNVNVVPKSEKLRKK